ncbi:MAG: hypothetical protein D6696_12110 [Acidobacteria bacterium]|nr:MAG: hypothetical protein D6696_12110 [Acidobacteriota bacterium]
MARPRIACFVSSHGFGHAARVCAVLEALARRLPALEAVVWSAVPGWFWRDNLGRRVRLVAEDVDPGLVQRDALDEDLAASAARLSRLLPPAAAAASRLGLALRRLDCRLVLCDVAPLGLLAAGEAGVPAALMENFTWDFIYRAYAGEEPLFARLARALEPIYAGADLHLQLEPCCAPRPAAVAVPPVARRPRHGRAEVRRRLGIPDDEAAVLLTMGGIPWRHRVPPAARRRWLILPGDHPRRQRRGRAVFLPHRSAFFHPDLVAAADAVIAKLGYSTLAEVHCAGVPLAYVPRRRFPESPVLEAWAAARLSALPIAPEAFRAGRWTEILEPLLALPRSTPPRRDGAEVAADCLLPFFDG